MSQDWFDHAELFQKYLFLQRHVHHDHGSANADAGWRYHLLGIQARAV